MLSPPFPQPSPPRFPPFLSVHAMMFEVRRRIKSMRKDRYPDAQRGICLPTPEIYLQTRRGVTAASAATAARIGTCAVRIVHTAFVVRFLITPIAVVVHPFLVVPVKIVVVIKFLPIVAMFSALSAEVFHHSTVAIIFVDEVIEPDIWFASRFYHSRFLHSGRMILGWWMMNVGRHDRRVGFRSFLFHVPHFLSG